MSDCISINKEQCNRLAAKVKSQCPEIIFTAYYMYIWVWFFLQNSVKSPLFKKISLNKSHNQQFPGVEVLK